MIGGRGGRDGRDGFVPVHVRSSFKRGLHHIQLSIERALQQHTVEVLKVLAEIPVCIHVDCYLYYYGGP